MAFTTLSLTDRPDLTLPRESFTWEFPGGPLRIEIPLDLVARLQAEIDRHRRRNAEAAQAEMGGVLLGSTGAFPNTIQIEDYICVPAARKDGRFVLDPAKLKPTVAPGEQRRAVGYFRTECGDVLQLRAEERDAVQKGFSDRRQVALLIQNSPQKRNAGFLFWDGDEFTPNSFMDFPFDAEVLKLELREKYVDPPAEGEGAEVEPEPLQAPAPERGGGVRTGVSWKRVAMLCAAMFGLGAAAALLGMYYFGPFSAEMGQPAFVTDSLPPAVTTPASQADAPRNPASGAPSAGRLSARVHRATIVTTGASWISACLDGQALEGKILPAGSNLEVEFFRHAELVLGNAGAIKMALEGQPVGPLGPESKVRLVELTASGFHVNPSGTLDRCGKQ